MSKYVDGLQLRNGLIAAAENLENRRDFLNKLNVYPVADRDTGANMALSMKKTVAALPDYGTPAEIANATFLNLLEYSLGNSGTILTLFFEGFSNGIPDTAQISGSQLAAAIKVGADTAFYGVAHPENGTILSVVAQCAEAGISILEFTDNADEIMMHIVNEAHACLSQTSFQNPVLRPLGVVDSGALGFCLILDGLLSAIMPECILPTYPEFHVSEVPSPSPETIRNRYCTELVITLNCEEDSCILHDSINPLGEYFFLLTSGVLCKIHIHTDNPEEVIRIAKNYGHIKSKKIDDMTVSNT